MNKIQSIQGLRAIAFIAVFLSHCAIGNGGGIGVSIFLVLSGMLMVLNHHNDNETVNLAKCWQSTKKHICRLYPLHITMTVLAVPLLLKQASEYGKGVLYIIGCFFANVALLQSWFPVPEIRYSMNNLSWFLCVSAFCYFCFPVINRYISKLNNTIKCIVLIIFIILTQWVYGMAVNHMVEDCEIVKGLVYNFPIARIMDFLLGALLGKVVVLSDKIDYRWNIIYDIVAIWLIIVTQLVVELLEAKYWWTYAAFLSPGVLLFIWCVINEKSFISKICSCNVLIKIGEDSAYLYLIHELVIRYSRIVLRKVVDVNQLDIKIGIAVVSLMITFCLVILWKKIYVNCDWKKMYLRHQ